MEAKIPSSSELHPILALYDAGFGEDLIPIIPPDAPLSPGSRIPAGQRGKVPGQLGHAGWFGFNWRKLQTTRPMVESWIADGASIGLRTRRFATIDVDVLDETLAQAIEDVLALELGKGCPILKRTGRSPKFAMPCRNERPFGKIRWVLRGEDGRERGVIEVLGDGQQFVIHGAHPKTGMPYVWSQGETSGGVELLVACRSAGLPEISVDQLTGGVFQALEDRLRSHGAGLESSGNHAAASGPAPNQELLRAPNIAELRAAVAGIPNDDAWPDRDDYIDMGFAIKAAAGPDYESDGLEIFLEWAGRWTNGTNEPDQVRTDWCSMKPPFRRGWEWIAGHARAFGYNDAANHFGTAPNMAPLGLLPPPPPDSKHTDMGNAGRFARRYRNELRYVTELGWLVFNGRQWTSDGGGAKVLRMAKQVVREMYAEAAHIEEKEVRDALVSHARKSEAERPLRAMVSLASPELTIPSGSLNADPWLLNVSNGVVDLRTGALRAHDPNFHLTKLSPAALEPGAPAPTWLAFLDRVFGGDQELIEFVQRAVGYSLTGLTGEQVLFLLHGSGANGKSTFLEALREVLGEYSAQAEFSTFVARGTGGPRNDIARLQGARLVAAGEAEAGERLAEATVKQLTGGDAITARFLYKEHFEFRPQFKIWLAANHKPAIHGGDHAIWRRILMIPFLVTIPEEERNPALLEKLRAERDGILRWAVEGCLSWQEQGLKRPAAVRQATEGYRAELDWLAAFVQEHCVVAPNGQVRTAELYERYVIWCRERNEVYETRQAFNERLASHDPGRIRRLKTGGYEFWRGLELRPQPIASSAEELAPTLEAVPA